LPVRDLLRPCRLLASGDSADCTIICGDQTFLSHKAIIRRCAFFKSAFSHDWLEAKASAIELPKDSPYLIARLLLWLYTSTYPSEPLEQYKVAQKVPTAIRDYIDVHQQTSEDVKCAAKCLLHLGMAALSDKYGVPNLGAESLYRFMRCFHDENEDEIIPPEEALNENEARSTTVVKSTDPAVLESCYDVLGSINAVFRTYALDQLHLLRNEDADHADCISNML
jgi:hypothetical protein